MKSKVEIEARIKKLQNLGRKHSHNELRIRMINIRLEELEWMLEATP